MRNLNRAPVLLAATSALALVAGCASDDGAATASTDTDREVVAAFYPLEYVTGRLAGDSFAVTGLTAPGAEPHDLELTPQDVAEVSETDLLVYLSGFQPAVDDAVESAGSDAFDVADSAALNLTYGGDSHQDEEHGEEHADEGADEHGDDEHADEGADEHGDDEHAEGEQVTDPHFWLDPLRLADVGDALADRLSDLDPDSAQTYEQNAADLRTDLEELDAEFSEGLAECKSRDLVTSHVAFGYLAERYDLTQVGVSGLSPEDEPSPAELAEVTDFVTTNDVGAIYFETLVSPDIAQTVADETGAETATLDPLEGLTDESAGDDYLEVMRSNLEVLQQGQSCT